MVGITTDDWLKEIRYDDQTIYLLGADSRGVLLAKCSYNHINREFINDSYQSFTEVYGTSPIQRLIGGKYQKIEN